MSKPSLVIVIAEDGQHRMLVSRYLKKRGMEQHAIRAFVSPAGQGSAENWVRKKFVRETSIYRSRHAQTALIVVIDADTRTVQDRLGQLDQALKDNGKRAVDSDTEQIARLVTKRNIETWILCLNEHAVDEETDYKNNDDWSKLIARSAETLFQWTRSGAEPPAYCVASLRSGIKEPHHLKF